MVNEGQGWNFFKKCVRNMNDEYKQGRQNWDAAYSNWKNDQDEREAERNYIKTGNIYGNANVEDYDYIEDGSAYRVFPGTPINRGFTGRLGRRAGVAAAKGYAGLKNLQNKFRR